MYYLRLYKCIYRHVLRCASKVREEFASVSGDNIKRIKKKILVLYFINTFLMQFDLNFQDVHLISLCSKIHPVIIYIEFLSVAFSSRILLV